MSEGVQEFKAQIIDFNPRRMDDAEATRIGIPEDLRPLLADKRQYPLNIAKHLPNGTVWFGAEQPWFYRSILADEKQAERIKESDVLILSGSGMSAYKLQENIPGAFSDEDREYLEKSQQIIRDKIGEGKWVLGICFGGQLAIEALGGKIGRLSSKDGKDVTEAGWLGHQLTDAGENDEVFGNLPKTFYAPHLHNDYVSSLPEVGSVVMTSNGNVVVTRTEVLAVRKGYLDNDGLQNSETEYIQASVVEFDNGARLYQIQPHPEMSTEDKANFLVRQNPWVAEEMGEAYYLQALEVPENADFGVSGIITRFIEQAKISYEQSKAVQFIRSVVGQNVEQFAPYLLQ